MFSCFTEAELRQYLAGSLEGERRSGAAEHLPTLDDEDPQSGPRQVGGRYEAVVSAADHDGIPGRAHLLGAGAPL